MTIFNMQATFGKLENRTLTLSDGLNIIEGSNESGKSTWCAFIRAMFYGINTSERDSKGSLAIKNKYRPWSGSQMSGTMKLHSPIYGEITLERRTANLSAPMRDFRAYSDYGEEISLSYSDVGEKLLGIDLSCFERSAFIETPQFPSGSTGELERRILSLVSSGDENSSYTDARSSLRSWQRKLQFRNSGKIPDLEGRIKLLNSDLEASKNNSAELDAVQQRITALESERKRILGSIAEKQSNYRDTQRDRLQAAQERLAAADHELLKASEQLPCGNPKPTAEEIRKLERLFYSEQEKKRTADAQSALLREKQRQLDQYRLHLSEHKPFGGCTAQEAKEIVYNDTSRLRNLTVNNISGHIYKKSLPFLFIPLALAILLFILSPQIIQGIPSWIFSALIIVLSPFVLLTISHSKAKKRVGAIVKSILGKYEAKNAEEILKTLDSYVSLIDEYTRMKGGIEANLKFSRVNEQSGNTLNRIKSIFPSFVDASTAEIESGLSSAVQSALTAIDNYRTKLAERQSAEEFLNAFNSEWASDSKDDPPRISFIPDEENSELDKVENELTALRRQKALLEGKLSHLRNTNELEHEIRRLQESAEKMRKNYSAISLALDTLSDAYRLIRERFSPRLNEETSEIFSALTSDKYNRVIINKEFEAMASGDASEGLRRALELSRGTADQLYLALRLAISKIVLPSTYRVPIILDDALLSFDDDRMTLALEWLYNESKERQILLFTCHNREGAYLNGRERVNVQSLN